MESPPEEDFCSICHDGFTLPCQANCSHWFCERQEPEASRVLENIEKYNRNFGGGSSSLIQRLRDLPFFIRRLLREMMDPQRSLPIVLRVRVILAMALTAIYVLSPVDIIPEVRLFVKAVIGKRDHINVEEAADANYDVDGRHRWMVKERSVSPQVSSLIAQEIH
ncbi:RING finger protein [Musa troglodytarum]|uniref:RING finger protein n=1 Tax=Musa troglodytarum TaxID=320322 RepID=A0A9E7KNA9_9LILI|nr:RING finger protein [Musa troglodytarum]